MNKEIAYYIYTDYYRLTGSEYNTRAKIRLLFAPGYGGVDGFRLMRLFRKAKGSKGIFGLVRKLRYYRFAKKVGAEIPLETTIGKGFIIWHTNGIVFNYNAKIGDNCQTLHQVTIGNSEKDPNKVANVGSCTSLGAGSKLIGPIVVGHHVSIGANAVVTHDLPDMCTVAGTPANVIRIRSEVIELHTDYLSFENWIRRKKRK